MNRVICLVLLLSLSIWCVAQDRTPFKHIRVDHGLVSNHISSIVKDSSGFVWFGTNTGLTRYDGYRFKTYANRAHDTTSLLHNSIVNLFVGFDRKLWVRTHKGVCIYDTETDSFSSKVDPVLQEKGYVGGSIKKMIIRREGEYVLYDDGMLYCAIERGGERTVRLWDGELTGKLTDICLDEQHRLLWLVTDKGHLIALNTRDVSIRHHSVFRFEKMVDNSEFRLFVDEKAGLWVYAQNFPFGALHYRQGESSPVVFRQIGGDVTISNNYISNIQQINEEVWLATDHGGINIYNLQTGKTRCLLHDRLDASSLPYNSTTALYKDEQGIMWVGTYKGGVSYYHPDLNHFSWYQNQAGAPQSLPFNDVNCFVEDREGIVWIGTNGGGLLRFDPRDESYHTYVHDPEDTTSLGSNVVVSLHIDRMGTLWVGTYHGGLNKFDKGRFTRFKHDAERSASINDNSVWSVLHDSRGRFWVGMLSGGIDLFDIASGNFQRFKAGDLRGGYSSYNAKIIEDRKGNIWIGTSNGIAKLAPDGQINLYNEDTKDYPLTNNVVSDIVEDRFGNIWVATQSGINILSPHKVTHLSASMGLVDNVVVGLVLDNYGDVWATTMKGVSRIRYNMESQQYSIHNYDSSDGLQSANFNERAIYKLKNGTLLFGGSEGFNTFVPQPIYADSEPKIVLVDFRIQGGKDSKDDHRSLIQKWLKSSYGNRVIRVPNQVHTFSVLLADFDFLQSYKAKLQYQIKGLNGEWIDVDNMEILLSNLGAGDYKLLVRTIDHKGGYSNPLSLIEISVAAPWWKTRWAYLVYFSLIGGLLFLSRKLEKMRERTRYYLLQAEQKARHAKEMDELRTHFFTTVSHEFRTPISLIISPAQKLMQEEREPSKINYLRVIERNAISLLNLVNQLLDLNKMEKGAMKLEKKWGDIFAVLNRVGEQFDSIAQNRNIRYVIDIPNEEWQAMFDFEKLERIVLNLLSNAFKFTPRGGEVRLTVDPHRSESKIHIVVSDTGIGVSSAAQENVFTRYYQAYPRRMPDVKGSGLGLAIVKELVELMGGKVNFSSEEHKGTQVAITLPIPGEWNDMIDTYPGKKDKIRKKEDVGLESENIRRILIIEDHQDYASYLTDSLAPYFHVAIYGSAEEAWRHVPQFRPDLIVSDLYLPGQSGIEFCKRIRQNTRTMHIPFILITGVNDEQKQLDALSCGANDFITKPFSLDVFLSKVKSLIDQQDIVEKRYKRQVDVQVTKSDIVNEDEVFVLKVTSIVEEHLLDDNFSVEALASYMHMTRVGLYKKILSITGYSPIEFIRNIRLNKALYLLKHSQKTVSEIAYEVGFGSPKQFTKHFKNFYGDTPTSFRK